MSNDLFNSLFEFVGAIMCYQHIRQIKKDKGVQGVARGPFAFFTAWGLWNCWFYPSVDCWFSFAGGMLLVLTQLWYCILLWYYWKNKLDQDLKVSLEPAPERT